MPDGREATYGKRMMTLATIQLVAFLLIHISLPVPVLSSETAEQPLGWMGDDFIISYPNGYNASHPAIAVTPRNPFTLGNGLAGSVHAVWDEINEFSGMREIYYSMSADGGYTWTGEYEDNRISDDRQEKMSFGDAVCPSVAVDSHGRIHVIWAERYNITNTWEVHYSGSSDNGKTWTSVVMGDIRISSVESSFEAHRISAPKIAVGIIPEREGPDILHAVWSEHDMARDMQEVFYSQSMDGGKTWTGFVENRMISAPSETVLGFAADPDISVSGEFAEFVHVSWNQMVSYELDDVEVFYLKSPNEGNSWDPQSERPITPVLGDGMIAQGISMTTYGNDVHLIWSQAQQEQTTGGIFYLGSHDNGNTWPNDKAEEIPINNNDGNIPSAPSLAVTETGHAFVFWSEFDDEFKTMEVHTSDNERPMDPESQWTGQKGDIIISAPDGQDASNISVAVGALPDGNWIPQVVWEEFNNEEMSYLNSGDGNQVLASPQNEEIHYNPPGSPSYTIAATSGTGGSITPSGDVNVPQGDDQSFTISANTGYHITDVYVDGSPQGAITAYTFYDVHSNHTIHASFAVNTYSLTVSIVGSGAVAKNPDQPFYTHGQTVQLTASHAFGWSFSHWSGALSGSANPTSILMNSDKVVNANFIQNIHTESFGTTGWKLVSLPLVQSDTSVASVLSSISGSYDSVKYYSNTDPADHWKSYRPGASTNDLTDIDHTMAFWVNITSPCTLTVYGDIPISTSITLYAGWNFVGYPTQDTSKTVSTALAGVTYDFIEGYQSSSPYITPMTGTDPMMPGGGYWIKVPANTLWNINW